MGDTTVPLPPQGTGDTLPPPPPGTVMMDAMPPPPPGTVWVDTASTPPLTSQQTAENEGTELRALGPVGAAGAGIASELAKTAEPLAQGVAYAYERLRGRHLGALSASQVEPENPPLSYRLGGLAEQTGEFLGGEEMLKGAAGLLRIAERAPEVLALIEKYPKAARTLLNMTVAAGQGAVKAPAEGEGAAKGAVAGATGAGIGGLVFEGLSRLIPNLPGLVHGRLTAEELAAKPMQADFQPAAAVTKGEVLDYAAQHGIKLTPGEAVGTKFREGMEGLGKRALGGSILEGKIRESQDAFRQAFTGFTDRLDPSGAGKTEESMGTALQGSVDAAKRTAHNAVNAAYNALPPELRDAVVDMRPIWQEWLGRWNDDLAMLRNLPAQAKNELENVYKLAAGIGTNVEGKVVPRMKFSDALRVRTAIRELSALSNAELPDRVEGLYRQLGHDLTEAMTRTADSSGFKNDWTQASGLARQYHADFGDRQSPLFRLLQQHDPVRAAQTIVNRMSGADIDALRRVGVDLRPLQRFVGDDIAKAGYRVNSNGLGGYSDSFLNKLFGAEKPELYRASAVGRRLGFEVNPSGTSNVLANEWAIGQLLGSVGALATGHPVVAASTLAPSAATIGASLPRAAEKYLPRVAGPAEEAVRRIAGTVGAALGRAATGFTRFEASDGSIHDVPTEHLDRAREIDPGLRVLEPPPPVGATQ